MQTSILNATGFTFIALTLSCLLLIFLFGRKYLKERGLGLGYFNLFTGLVVLWLCVISILSLNGFFADFSVFPPKLGIVLFIPVIVLIILLNSQKVNKLLLVMPANALIYLQAFRVIVEILLWALYENGKIPVQMTFEGRNLDILVGLTAPVFAFCYNKFKWGRGAMIAWNLFGLALLINIVAIALLSIPTPFRYFMNEPANTIVATFPYILLPGFLVPLAYYLHMLSFKKALIIK